MALVIMEYSNLQTKVTRGVMQGHTNISIYDILGQKVKIVINKNEKLGLHEINLNLNLQQGIYFLVLLSEGNKESKSFIIN